MTKHRIGGFSVASGTILPAAFVGTALMLGGFPIVSDWRFFAILLVGSACLANIMCRASDRAPGRLPRSIPIVAMLILSLPLVQLIELPPSWSHNLSGRSLETQVRFLADAGDVWLPLALSPATNIQLAVSLVMLMSLAYAVFTLDQRGRHQMVIAVVALACFEFVLGSIQFGSDGTLLTLPGYSDRGRLIGTFANRNHAALFFACAILFAGSVAAYRPQRDGAMAPKGALALGGTLAVAFAIAILGTGSRSGVGLAAVALMLSVLMIAPARSAVKWLLAGAGLLAVAGTAMVFSLQRVEKLAERYGSVGGDLRWEFWINTLPLIESYMPWGSGFGTFSDVYAKGEKITQLIPTYVNNVHNDYLELMLEAGIPGGLVLLIAVGMLIWLSVRGIRQTSGLDRVHIIVGSGIILLIALHSIVDYPLRRLGMASLLFVGIGLLLSQFQHHGHSSKLPS